ncbi:MAG TPA: hypothetical protein VEX41_08160 [Candidatus Eisenbacteria bacterium]|nr:hypothetical protein [Candidatus Eisenbacteria bacterium]
MNQPRLPLAASAAGAGIGAPAGASSEAPEQLHPCVRCGRPVAIHLALCEQCNPLELAQPSATQVHGIAALGIITFVAVLFVLGRFALAGTGPFSGIVDGVAPAEGGLAVTLLVSNAGTKPGATTCRLTPDGRPVGGPGELIQTPVIPAGSDLRFTASVTRLGTTPIGLAVDCQSP